MRATSGSSATARCVLAGGATGLPKTAAHLSSEVYGLRTLFTMLCVCCTLQEGCGSPGSCTSYTSSLTSMSNANSLQGMLPAAGFGKYAAGCNADGTYPYGTCSLKQVSSVDNAPAWGVGPAAAGGWVAGVVPKPPSSIKGCPLGLTDMTCRTCAVTHNPALCYSCMQGSVTFLAGISKCVTCANGGRC